MFSRFHLLCLYISFRELRDFSLKQYTVSSPSQMVRGSGYFRRSRYLSTAPGKYFSVKIFDRNKNILWGLGVRRQWVVTCLRQQIQLTFTINATNVLAEEPTSGSVVIYLYTCLGSGLSEVEMKILPRYCSAQVLCSASTIKWNIQEKFVFFLNWNTFVFCVTLTQRVKFII